MKLLSFLFIFSFFCFSAQAEIIKLDSSFSAVERKVAELSEDYAVSDFLIAFDIDMTLLIPHSPAIYYPNIRQYIKEYRDIIQTLPKEKQDYPKMLTVFLPQREIDKYTSEAVMMLQAKGYKTIAFTGSFTGSFGEVLNFEHARYDLLKLNFFDFSKSFPDYETLVLKNLPSFRGNHPVFYKGILSSNHESKGLVMIEFLKQIHFNPKVIIMVDDQVKNLEEVEAFLKDHMPHSRFIGFEYRAAHHFRPEPVTKQNFREFWEHLRDQALKINN